jgi:tRNA/rRNA methyltransferase
MKTMGFTTLRIVTAAGAEQVWTTAEARAFAHGSTEILENVVSYASVAEAIVDCDLVIGTTARRRGMRTEYRTPRELAELLTDGERGERIAILFGREESGLTNEELELCQVASSIPMRGSYPSLNLGQSVMVYCYELAPLMFSRAQRKERDLPRETARVLHEAAAELLPRLGFEPSHARYGRMMERLGSLRRTDAHLLLSLARAIEKLLTAGADDPTAPSPHQGREG